MKNKPNNSSFEKIKNLILCKEFILLSVFFALGLFLRVFKLWDNIIFSYDQARDAQRIFDIFTQHHLKLVGPETDIPGIFNGPLFYYLIAPVYFFFRFDPNFVSLFLVFLNLSGIFLLYKCAVVIFDNKKIGLLAGFLWAISFEQANFAKYISNSSLMSLSALVFFLGLSIYILRRKPLGILISIIGMAVGIHFNIYLIYLGIFYVLYYFVFFPKIDRKMLLLCLIILLLILSPFFIAEIKWSFAGVKSLVFYLSKQQNALNNVFESLSFYAQKLSETLYYSFFSFNNFFALSLLLFFIVLMNKNIKSKNNLTFLYIWAASTLPLFAFRSGVINVPVINSTIFGATTLIFAAGIYELLINNKYRLLGIIFLILIFVSNLNLFTKDKFINVRVLSIQPMLLSYEKNVIDYTYRSSGKSDFSLCAVTEPLFVNALWSYLYNLYGKNKYGYFPYWSGPKQYLNPNYFPYDKGHVPLRYIILENTGGIPEHAKKATVYLEDQISQLDEEKKFGDITVQKRHLVNDKSLLRNTQDLSASDIASTLRITKIDDRFSCYHSY